MSGTRTADFVVAGGGTAGSIVARRLADAGAEVILIEAGPSGEHDDRVLRLSRHNELLGTELDWDYGVEAPADANPAMRYGQAKVLGGCSSHNTAIAFRTPDWDLRNWEAAGAAGWGPAGMEETFERLLERVNLEDPDVRNPLALAFIEAGQQWGLPRKDFGERNLRDAVGSFKLSKRGPIRESTAVAYLFPLDRLPSNLTVATGETVRRLLFDGDRAVGVETDRGVVRAREEVVLSAGAFQSPKLLMLSGVGPAAQLREHGIAPLVDLPGVGQHLTDHACCLVLWKASRPLPAADSHWETGGFTTVTEGGEFPDVSFHFTTAVKEFLDAMGLDGVDGAFSLCPGVTQPRSIGQVRLRSADPDDHPIVEPNWFTDADGYDLATMVEGLERAREIAAQPALAAWVERELAPGPDVQSHEQLAAYARAVSSTGYHAGSTCRMGAPDDPAAVVDPELRVRGVRGLRVADTSVFPFVPTPNPALTAMAVGEKCAHLVLAGRAQASHQEEEAV